MLHEINERKFPKFVLILVTLILFMLISEPLLKCLALI